MMRSVNIRWRLTLWYGGVLAIVLAAFGIATYVAMRYQLLERIDLGLQEELADVVSEVQRATDRPTLLSWLDRRFGRHAGFDFQVTGPAGERLFANERFATGRFPLPNKASLGPSPKIISEAIEGGRRYRIVTQTVEGPEGPVVVQIGRTLDAYDHELSELLIVLLTTGTIALGTALAGGYFMARRAIAPIDRMTIAANRIDARRLDQRLEIANRDDELGRLAQTLNHMLDRLQRSFSQMQQFTADASHELRTPLTVIRTEAEVALRKPPGEGETQELLGNVLEECQRLTWITDQLLTLSREDAGLAQPAREPVDLSKLVRDVAETMRPIAESKNQKLVISANGAAIMVGDPVRLRHVIYNLVDNAIKYTPPNGRLEIAVATLPRSVRLSIKDTGVGISPEHLPHVFERFYRVDKARNRVEGGAGLGLSIVQSIVQAHGGQVRIESQPGVGTHCTVQLPREEHA